jgi:hypothetical protein
MLTGQWMLNLIIRHVLKKLLCILSRFGCVCLQSLKKVLKIDNRTLIFVQIKYEFDTDSGSFEKVAKNPEKNVINEKDWKMEF